MATNAVMANGHHNGKEDNRTTTEDIYDGITEHLENILCQQCHELKQMRVLPCSKSHPFCEDCLDRAMILRKCPSCMTGFLIPPGGVSGMDRDVTRDQIKDMLDSLCKLRSTNCPVCALDENQAKLASKVYKFCRREKELVCDKCVELCERDLELMDYNRVPDTATDRNPSAPEAAVSEVNMEGHNEVSVVKENGLHHEPELSKKLQDDHSVDNGQPVEVNGDDSISSASSVEEDTVDAIRITPPASPSRVSPSVSPSSSYEPIMTPPPAYEAQPPLPRPYDPDVPILHEKWSHMGSPLSRANDVIFIPNDDSIVVADWYAGQMHKFSNEGKLEVSKLLKNSPWSFVKERSKGPWSVAYSYTNDKLYVSEIGRSSLCVMSPKDLKVEKNRLTLEGVQNPAGLAFLRNNQLVLTEDTFRGAHRVAIYDLNGKLVKDWESSDPQLVCVDNEDRIVVSDHNNHCVEVFDTTGRLLTHFGDADSLPHPMGVATDRHGNIYVTHEIPKNDKHDKSDEKKSEPRVQHGYQLSLWSSDGRRVGTLQQWDHGTMNLTERDNWHMRSVDVHGNNLVLLGRRTMHGYTIKG